LLTLHQLRSTGRDIKNKKPPAVVPMACG